ncbi:eCIS core domain-containing protein [Streptomyces rubiginosohelvolus]|uniref:eCIS core domain-containing protein n=1 Tax=Streptomyces rubiginosohelvolus TaxID=67362 RepID=UPI00364B4516
MRAHQPKENEQEPQRPARGMAERPGEAAVPGGRVPDTLLALQRTTGNAAVLRMLQRDRHRHGPDCGHQQPGAEPVQRSAVHDVLRAPGRPLDAPLREEMESRLGSDFSDVRLHTDSAARASAAEVGARAYTSGSHVVIGDGGGDKHTLAHELTHVIQQRQGPVAGTDNGSGLSVSDPGDRFEREAEANAVRVMRRTPEQSAQSTQSDQGSRDTSVQREAHATARDAARGTETTAVQRFSEGNTEELGSVRRSENGLYLMPLTSGADTTVIWVAEGASPPRYCTPTGQSGDIGGRTYTEYEPETAFLADCAHTAEEIMHRQRLALGQDASAFALGGAQFGLGDQENVEGAQAYAAARPGGPHANGEERPGPGEAYAIVETAWQGDYERPDNTSGWPYHVAAVVAVDGDDHITVEQAADGNDAKARQGHEGIIDMYTAGTDPTNGQALPNSFHGRNTGGPVQHFTVGAITVILQPINVGGLKKETGRRKLM